MVFLHWVAPFFHTSFDVLLVLVSTQTHWAPPFNHDGAFGVISHQKSLVECHLYHCILLSLSFIVQNEWRKLSINSWNYHFLSCSTSPVDNAHIPLYYEYLKFLPAVCRLYNHILCLISFHFHFQSMKLAINSWSYHFLSCSTSPVDNTHLQEPPGLLQSASHGNLQITSPKQHMPSSINQSYVQLTLMINRLNIQKYFEYISWQNTLSSGGHHTHIVISGISSQYRLSHSHAPGAHSALTFIDMQVPKNLSLHICRIRHTCSL